MGWGNGQNRNGAIGDKRWEEMDGQTERKKDIESREAETDRQRGAKV